MLSLCSGFTFSWTNECNRAYFEALPPFILAILLILIALPSWSHAERLRRFAHAIKGPCHEFLTLEEAELLILDNKELTSESWAFGETRKPPLWRTACFTGIALGETVVWFVLGSYHLAVSDGGVVEYTAVAPFFKAISWIPATVLPVIKPKLTPSYGLLAFYFSQLVTGAFRFGAILYDHDASGISSTTWTVLGAIAHLSMITVLLLIVLFMPVNLPSSEEVSKKIGTTISLEDYTPLWGWITFEWVWPIIKKGNNQTLHESDVWELSATMQSKPVSQRFVTTPGKTLFWKIWAANSFDIIIDFVLTVASVIFNYGGIFFLNRILFFLEAAATDPSARSQAYIYSFLMFLSTVLKDEADVIHLWYGRRASTRVRTELMTAIYAKALVRKDFSGVIRDNEDSAPHFSSNDKKSGKEKRGKSKTTGADVGKIVNLMSGDAGEITTIVGTAYFYYSAPFEIIIGSIFLYKLLGLSAFAGLLFIGVGSPITNFLTKRANRLSTGLSAARDRRMDIVNELIQNIKLIKFYGWENRWVDRVIESRNNELNWLIKRRTNQVFFRVLGLSLPIVISVVSFFTFIISGHELTIPVAFTAISLFAMIRIPLSIFPQFFAEMADGRVSLERISAFLNEEEVSTEMSRFKRTVADRVAVDDQTLGIMHASFKWNEKEESAKTSTSMAIEGEHESDRASIGSQSLSEERRFELRDIDVIFPEGELSLVVGPTASGKTALLMALLGEMTMQPGNGRILLPKHQFHPDKYGYRGVSYAAQAPFLQHLSIRDNILFGELYEEERYEAVLHACALEPDLKIFESGDLTEIGSRGISLSGGQKARVALARAVYSKSKCVLLDDPLSAVDSHTALFLYERLLKGPLMANRTLVLVTHNVELVLPGAFYIVHMLDGRINFKGKVDEIRSEGLLDIIIKESRKESLPLATNRPPESPEDGRKDGLPNVIPTDNNPKRPRRLVQEEARQVGGVKWKIYKKYMKASSYWTWIILIAGISLSQFMGLAEKLWIKQWGEAYTNASNPDDLYLSGIGLTKTSILFYQSLSTSTEDLAGNLQVIRPFDSKISQLPSANEHPLLYVGIYASITVFGMLISITNMVVQINGGLRASRILLQELLVAVIRATMRWHDSTPAGRMLNRFGKDITTIDTTLASSLQNVNSSLATFIISIITVIFISPFFIIPATIIAYIYYKLGSAYLKTGRDLRRMESNSRSPIYSTFSELLAGIVTVRAFSSEHRFFNSLHKRVDTSTKMWYYFWMTNRWLLLHFDFLGAVAVLFTAILAIHQTIGPGLAGVTITSAMGFTQAVYWTCRFWTQLELDSNAVERVVEYLELPQEPPLVLETNKPPAYWPSISSNNALIDVKDLVIRYAPELPPVIHGISFKINNRERVGLLGRTGSGKSTLAMSLLRFAEPSGGSIKIDGIDITSIGLHDLRSRITFVAQDAVLFSGTIRENIDPFGDYTDAECLDALARVHILDNSEQSSQITSTVPSIQEDAEETVSASTVGSMTLAPEENHRIICLDTQVSPGGGNFSQGQRQLLTLARALLRRSSIIILDEATSSIDYATDVKIQKTIREEFKDSLLLTIAHRLQTIIDYDRLIILESGRVVESDSPYNLMQRNDSVFRDMCIHSGNFDELEKVAIQAWSERTQGY